MFLVFSFLKMYDINIGFHVGFTKQIFSMTHIAYGLGVRVGLGFRFWVRANIRITVSERLGLWLKASEKVIFGT